jgi:hypothetical protein
MVGDEIAKDFDVKTFNPLASTTLKLSRLEIAR